jgi:hypothetical protein
LFAQSNACHALTIFVLHAEIAIYLIAQIQAASFVKNIFKDVSFAHPTQHAMNAFKDTIYQIAYVSIVKRIFLPAYLALIQLTVQFANKVTIL